MNMHTLGSTALGIAIVATPLAAFADHSATVGASVDAHIETHTENVGAKAQVGANVEDRSKERGRQEIERRIKGLTELSARINGAKRLDDTTKASITATLSAQIDALKELDAKIQGDSSTTTLRADIQSITKSYRVYALVMPQGAITAAADRVKNVAEQMAAMSAKLKTRLDALSAAGTDASASFTLLTDLDANVGSAKVKGQAALDLIANLKPDNGDAGVQASNTAALKSARDTVRAAQDDLKAAREDARKILMNIKGEGSVHATTTTP